MIYSSPLSGSRLHMFGFAESRYVLYPCDVPALQLRVKGCVWIFAFAAFMCVPFDELGSVWLSPRVPGDDPHPVVTIVMMLSALPCAVMCTLPRKTPTAGSHILVKDKNRGGGGGWYWWDIECNQSTVTLTGTEGLDGMVNKGDKKTKVLQPSHDLLHNSARSS